MKPKVTIVGAGIAGLTAAWRLAERGCEVTILEMESVPGGNLAGFRQGDAVYEVYPHMFGEWYSNFWKLIDDIGISRDTEFEPLSTCGFLVQGDFPNYRLLVDDGSPKTIIPNLFSNIIPPADMFLAAYAIIDLLTQNFEPEDMASAQTLNGFLVSRPYATEAMAKYFNTLVLNIWSIDSFLTSAYAFQRFAKFQFRQPSPQCRVLKNNSYSSIIEPLCEKLQKQYGCEIKLGVTVDGVTVRNGRVVQISHSPTAFSADAKPVVEEVENLILAVTPATLQKLVMQKASVTNTQVLADGGDNTVGSAAALAILERIEDVPIVHDVPTVSNTRRLAGLPIPLLYAWFKRELPGIPDYYVALVGSSYSMTFVKVQRLTKEAGGNTVLAIGASDFGALPVDLTFGPGTSATAGASEGEQTRAAQWTEAQRDTMYLMLKQFREFVPFNLGKCWGDGGDVDWGKTFLMCKVNQNLFVNEVGSRRFSPETSYAAIDNLYFAGPDKYNPITIATVEAAVCSGLEAARALWRKQDAKAAERTPIEVIVPKSYPAWTMWAWKLGLAPSAAIAKCWAVAEELAQTVGAGRPATPVSKVSGAASLLAQGAVSVSKAYVDWWKVMGSAVGLTAR